MEPAPIEVFLKSNAAPARHAHPTAVPEHPGSEGSLKPEEARTEYAKVLGEEGGSSIASIDANTLSG